MNEKSKWKSEFKVMAGEEREKGEERRKKRSE